MLLISAVVTVLIRLSLLQIESIETETVKVKLAANSADKIALVLTCVTAYYLIAFAFGAARDFASDRYRQKAASPELYAPINDALDTTRFLERKAHVTAESHRLMRLATDEWPSRDKLTEQFIKEKADLDRLFESRENEATEILRAAAKRENAEPLNFYMVQGYSELKATNPTLHPSEQEALELKEVAMADVKNQVTALEKKHTKDFEASQQRESELRSRSLEVLFGWGRTRDTENRELTEMIKTVTDLRRYRTTTKWIEAIFPCLLGFWAVLLELKSLLEPTWHSITQLLVL